MDGSDGPDASASSISRALAKAELLQVVDAQTMADFLDPQRDMKAYVYDIFKQNPALLAPTIEGLSKAEHRELVRKSLRTLLAAGFSPLEYFDSDIKKYIYMAEVCAPIDLSLVRAVSLNLHTANACGPSGCMHAAVRNWPLADRPWGYAALQSMLHVSAFTRPAFPGVMQCTHSWRVAALPAPGAVRTAADAGTTAARSY